MKSYLLASLLTLGLISSTAHADFYGSFGLGAAFNNGSVTTKDLRSSYDDSAAYSLAVGYQLPLLLTDVRVEGEYLRIHPDIKDGGHSNMDALMVNAYANLPLIPVIDPYVGLGLGYARFEHENTPAMQFMLGADYELPITLPITIGAEYRYFKVNEHGGNRGETAKFNTHALMLKARYHF
ncbi:MAG: porin family protein [Clostridia bacterium]|nr:porin family protein [Clostridia bacterium]